MVGFYFNSMKNKYIFQSERLGFRNWSYQDLDEFAAMNADEEVMKHFPNSLNRAESKEFIDRLLAHYDKWGFNYFAVELLDSGELIGFIGLAYQSYESEFTPSVDLGWRLKKNAWGKGYATEGAKSCMQFAFNELNINRLIATCTQKNIISEKVMQKIGMQKQSNFKHPKLKEFPEYEDCICYEIMNINNNVNSI